MLQSNSKFDVDRSVISARGATLNHRHYPRPHLRDNSNTEYLIAICGQQPVLAEQLAHSGYQLMYLSSGVIDVNTMFSVQPSLAIVDWMTAQKSGLEICHQISELKPDLPVLLLTQNDCVRQRIAGLNAGALSCVAKPYRVKEVMARVRAHIRNLPHSPEAVCRCGNVVLNRRTRQVYCDTHEVQLTAKEFNLLEYLMLHKQQIMTRDRIIRNVWGYDFMGESNLIEVYISCLRRKLKRASSPPLIHTVRNIGYVMKEEKIGASHHLLVST